jgi:hypothetical protein
MVRLVGFITRLVKIYARMCQIKIHVDLRSGEITMRVTVFDYQRRYKNAYTEQHIFSNFGLCSHRPSS